MKQEKNAIFNVQICNKSQLGLSCIRLISVAYPSTLADHMGIGVEDLYSKQTPACSTLSTVQFQSELYQKLPMDGGRTLLLGQKN